MGLATKIVPRNAWGALHQTVRNLEHYSDREYDAGNIEVAAGLLTLARSVMQELTTRYSQDLVAEKAAIQQGFNFDGGAHA